MEQRASVCVRKSTVVFKRETQKQTSRCGQKMLLLHFHFSILPIVRCEQANGVYYIDIQMHAMRVVCVRERFFFQTISYSISSQSTTIHTRTHTQYAISPNIRDTRQQEITETYHSARKQWKMMGSLFFSAFHFFLALLFSFCFFFFFFFCYSFSCTLFRFLLGFILFSSLSLLLLLLFGWNIETNF